MTSSSIDQRQWVIDICKALDEETEEIPNIPVSIFTVPKILMATDPDAYIPQQLALGPYHHWRPEVYDMQRYKISAAKRFQKQLQFKFTLLVEGLKKLEQNVRACYDKFLNIDSDTLAFMMAIDMSFLLEFLQVYAMREEGRALKKVMSGMSHLVDVSGTKAAHNAILRDMVMVENQIPLFLLRKMLEFQFSSIEVADETLHSMLMGIYNELSPFKMIEELPHVLVEDCAHLLDFLYHMILPVKKEAWGYIASLDHDQDEITEDKEDEGEESVEKPGYVRQALDALWNILSKLNAGPVSFIKKLIFAKPVTLLMNLPWKIISSLPVLKLLKEPIENLFSHVKESEKPENRSSNSVNKPPLIEEIAIPSVTELAQAGVCFSPTNSGILDISFDYKKRVLFLPTVSLDVNTEVFLRNLVAYEACNGSGPLVFTRYTELMNGIIDSEEDAKFLREKGIVLNHLKNDKEVANLWNGMSKSVKLTKVPFLDKTIEDVNKYYGGRWRVKLAKFMKVYVFGSWKLLTLFAALFLLILTTLQAFCSVYSCVRVLHLPDLGDTSN